MNNVTKKTDGNVNYYVLSLMGKQFYLLSYHVTVRKIFDLLLCASQYQWQRLSPSLTASHHRQSEKDAAIVLHTWRFCDTRTVALLGSD